MTEKDEGDNLYVVTLPTILLGERDQLPEEVGVEGRVDVLVHASGLHGVGGDFVLVDDVGFTRCIDQ